MNIFWLLVQLMVFLGTPFLALKCEKFPWSRYASPVVICYAVGIICGSFLDLPFHSSVSDTFSQATIVLAIPILLLKTDLRAFLRQARPTLISFALILLSVLLVTSTYGYLFADRLDNSAIISGMLTGVNIGGTPNLNAVGYAMGIKDSNLFVNLNAADLVCGGLYLFFITSVAAPFLDLFLPAYQGEERLDYTQMRRPAHWRDYVIHLITGVVLGGVAVAVIFLLTGKLNNIALIILLLTTLGIAASFVPKLHNRPGAIFTGNYLLLVFCVAIGSMADFGKLWSHPGEILIFTALVYTSIPLLHFFFVYLFKIDRDTVMITNTAAMYGPHFVGQVAKVINNPALIFPGISCGLVGYGLGNYLGIAVAEFLLKLGG